MKKLYDSSFKVGFILTIVLFVALNVMAWLNAGIEYSRVAAENRFLPVGGIYEWGFPYPSCCYQYYVADVGKGDALFTTIINIATTVGCAFVVGLAFHGIGRKISRAN